MPRIISLRQFARECGRAHPGIILRVRPGGELHAALAPGGIDADHPAAAAYRDTRRPTRKGGKRDQPRVPPAYLGLPPPTSSPRAAASTPPAAAAPPSDVPAHILDVLGWTVAQVVERHGTDLRFREWLTAVKLIAEIDDRRLRSSDRRGEVIDRELVRVHVLGAIDDALSRLVTDSPRTITARVRELVEAGTPNEQIELSVRDLISQQIRAMKSRATRGLDAAR